MVSEADLLREMVRKDGRHKGLLIPGRYDLTKTAPRNPMVLVRNPTDDMMADLVETFGGYPTVGFGKTNLATGFTWIIEGQPAYRVMQKLRPYVWGPYKGYIDSWAEEPK